jgi:hypothetical protein
VDSEVGGQVGNHHPAQVGKLSPRNDQSWRAYSPAPSQTTGPCNLLQPRLSKVRWCEPGPTNEK